MVTFKIQDGGRAPSWNCCTFNTTHEASVVGHISLSNFMSIRYIVSKIWWFEFLQIWLEMPIHTPKILFFGGKIWENFPLEEKW